MYGTGYRFHGGVGLIYILNCLCLAHLRQRGFVCVVCRAFDFESQEFIPGVKFSLESSLAPTIWSVGGRVDSIKMERQMKYALDQTFRYYQLQPDTAVLDTTMEGYLSETEARTSMPATNILKASVLSAGKAEPSAFPTALTQQRKVRTVDHR